MAENHQSSTRQHLGPCKEISTTSLRLINLREICGDDQCRQRPHRMPVKRPHNAGLQRAGVKTKPAHAAAITNIKPGTTCAAKRLRPLQAAITILLKVFAVRAARTCYQTTRTGSGLSATLNTVVRIKKPQRCCPALSRFGNSSTHPTLVTHKRLKRY